MELDENTRRYLSQMANQHERIEAQLQSLVKRYRAMASEREDDKMELRKMRDALKKAAARIRYIEDIPGKRVPYFMQFAINIPGPTSPSVTIAGSRLSDVKTISQDGPFVCTTYLSAFLLKTYSIGDYTVGENPANGRPNDPVAGTEVISPLSGRWRPVASTADAFEGAYIGARVGEVVGDAATLDDATKVKTFRPGTVDFTFEIADEGVDRLRQNQIPIPSRYLFTENDRPLYLPVSDFFERGSSIRFSATLTRDLGFAEVNYAALPNGFSEGQADPPPNPAIPDTYQGRQVLSLGGTLYFTMLGYKILQAQSPAV
jgi:hypothetical protein